MEIFRKNWPYRILLATNISVIFWLLLKNDIDWLWILGVSLTNIAICSYANRIHQQQIQQLARSFDAGIKNIFRPPAAAEMPHEKDLLDILGDRGKKLHEGN